VCPGLRFGSLYDGKCVGGGFGSVLAHHCRCARCGRELLVTLDELIAHEEACEGAAAPGDAAEPPAALDDGPGAKGEGEAAAAAEAAAAELRRAGEEAIAPPPPPPHLSY